MRTISIVIPFLLACLTVQGRPTRIVGSNVSWCLNYADDSSLISVADGREGGGLLWSYDYQASVDGMPYILQNAYSLPEGFSRPSIGEPAFYRESRLGVDGLISEEKNGNSFMWSTGESFEYGYSEGRLTKITGESGVAVALSWTEGNLTEMVFTEGGEEAGRITCAYGSLPAKGICQALCSPLLLLLDYYAVLPLGPLAHGYYGMLNRDMPSEVDIAFSEAFVRAHTEVGLLSGSYYPVCKRMSRKYSYEADAEGNITGISVTEDGLTSDYQIVCDSEEYVTTYVCKQKTGELQASVPLNTSAGYSKMEAVYECYADFSLCQGDRIGGLAFSGVNTGGAQQRHLEVWMEHTPSSGVPSGRFTSMDYLSKVFDGECTVNSGGSSGQPERILEIVFDTPIVWQSGNLRFTIICNDGRPGDEVLFCDACGGRDCSFVSAADAASASSKPERTAMPLTTFIVSTPVRYVSGTVSDEQGKGIGGATVQLTPWLTTSPVLSAETDGDGYYRIRVEAGNGEFSPTVWAPGHTRLESPERFTVKDNPVKDYTIYGSVTYPAGKRSTIILPTEPDATAGRYYTLTGRDGTRILFNRVMQPQANMPYVLFADRDYHVSLQDMDLGIEPGMTHAGGLTLAGRYANGSIVVTTNTVLMQLDEASQTGEAMHALLLGDYTVLDPEYCELVFSDEVLSSVAAPASVTGHAVLYDLQGRRVGTQPRPGLYISNGRKHVVSR